MHARAAVKAFFANPCLDPEHFKFVVILVIGSAGKAFPKSEDSLWVQVLCHSQQLFVADFLYPQCSYV